MHWLYRMVRREDPTAAVSTKLRRIFLERGLDYFEAEKGAQPSASRESQEAVEPSDSPRGNEDPPEQTHHMTPEELYKMRMESLPHL